MNMYLYFLRRFSPACWLYVEKCTFENVTRQ